MRDRRSHPIDVPGFGTLATVFKIVLLLALAAFGVFALFSVCTVLAALNIEREWADPIERASERRTDAISPQWTPDGSRIALGHMGGIYTIATDDASSLRRVHGGGELDIHRSPRISPDGSRMAYSKYEHSNWVLFTRHAWETTTSTLDGSDERNLARKAPDMDTDGTRHHLDHAWSPDGSRLALSLGNAVYAINADGSNMRLVINAYDSPVGYGDTGSLRWSPDGSRISFVIKTRDGYGKPISRAYTIGEDGSDLVRVDRGPTWSPPGEYLSSPTWSPDGSKIAFVKATRVDEHSAIYSTHTTSSEGGEPTAIHEWVDDFDAYIETKEVAWSPDGMKLLVSVANSVSVVNSDGSGARTLVNLRPARPQRNLTASWSPDGFKIAVYNEGGYEGALFIMSPDGSDKRVLALNGNPLRPAQNQAWDPAYDAPTPTPAPTPPAR